MEKGTIFDARYKIVKRLSPNSFSSLYKVYDQDLRVKLLLKIYSKEFSQFEVDLESFSQYSSLPGIPKIFSLGINESSKYLTLKLLRNSLENLNKSQKFSLKSCIDIASQILTTLEGIHTRHHIHRDLTPATMMLKSSKYKNGSKIFLTDFAQCKKYRDPVSKVHYKYRENAVVAKNFKFCSQHAHRGIEQARRDDIESWFYIFLHLVNQRLPWDYDALKGYCERVFEKKVQISFGALCEGLPAQFVEIISYIRNLKFSDQPNYNYLREKLKMILDEAEEPKIFINVQTVSSGTRIKNDFKSSRRAKSDLAIMNKLESIEEIEEKEENTEKSEEKEKNEVKGDERKELEVDNTDRRSRIENVKCGYPELRRSSLIRFQIIPSP